MAEHELELRLQAVARALDGEAPEFDAARLRAVRPPRARPRAVLLTCLVALAAVAVVPAAVSAFQALFDVDEVPVIGPLQPGVAPPYAGRSVSVEAAQSSSPFRLRLIPSLGAPDEARVRGDIRGGMFTIVYGNRRILLTQWQRSGITARIALVPAAGKAETVQVAKSSGLWIEGAARGTFTLIGADGAVHRESFEVGPGVLLWHESALTFLLQGASSRTAAIQLAGEVDR